MGVSRPNARLGVHRYPDVIPAKAGIQDLISDTRFLDAGSSPA